MKIIAAFLIAVLVAGLFWFVSTDSQDSPDGLAQASEPEMAEPTGPAAVETLDSELQTAEQAEREVVASNLQAASEESTTNEESDAELFFEGTVVIEESSGHLTRGVNGSLEMVVWKGNSGRHRNADIRDGAFRIKATDADHLTLSGVTIQDSGAMIVDGNLRYDPADRGAVLVVKRSRALHLSVVCAEDLMHLSDVAVTRSDSHHDMGQKHPGRVNRSNTVLLGGTSPVKLSATKQDFNRGGTSYFVKSPGYAWQAVQLDLKAGGEREVRLVRGGELKVRISGVEMKRGANLCMYTAGEHGGEPYLRVPSFGKETVEVEGILPGSYRVSIRVGKWYDSPLILGEQSVEITAGAVANVDLVLSAPPDDVLTPLAGVLVLPEEWGITNFTLSARLSGRTAGGTDGNHRLRGSKLPKSPHEDNARLFDFGKVATGTYNIEVRHNKHPSQLEYEFPYDVEVGTAGALRIEVPPPGDVVVHVLDESTGVAAGLSSLHWGSLVGDSQFSRSSVGVQARKADGAFEFRAPVGSISVSAFGGEFTTLREIVDVHAGQNEFTFRVVRNCPLVINFMDGETPVPVEGHFYPKPEHLGGEGKLLFTSTGSSGFRTALSEPGSYVFPASEFPKFAGFEPIPDQTITVARGENTTFTIQLIRSE